MPLANPSPYCLVSAQLLLSECDGDRLPPSGTVVLLPTGHMVRLGSWDMVRDYVRCVIVGNP